MRLPIEKASYDQLVRFGRYTARRLRRQKLTQLAQDTEKVTKKVKELGRAWEDAAEPVQDALADRDGADDDLDLFAKTTRHNLASRELTAAKQAPYINIFPNNIEYYTAAPLDENKTRYLELFTRLDKYLPPSDPLRDKLPELKEMIDAFAAAYDAAKAKTSALAVARDELDQASSAWRSYMEKLHGALTSQENKAAAERYFPKAARGSKVEEGDTKAPEGDTKA